jgi:hypothetical protein
MDEPSSPVSSTASNSALSMSKQKMQRETFETLINNDGSKILKLLWKWTMYSPEVVTLSSKSKTYGTSDRHLSLELLASASSFSSARLYLVKFEAVSKLLSLLSSIGTLSSESILELQNNNRANMNLEVDNVQSAASNDGIDLIAIRSIMKIIANLCAANETAKRIVKAKLQTLTIGDQNILLARYARSDELLSFYLKMIA